MSFGIAFTNVLITLFYMAPGFLMAKAKKGKPEHLSTLSAILVYVGTPFLEISAFLSMDYSREAAAYMALFLPVTLILQTAFMLLIRCLAGKKYRENRFRIMSIGAVLGNVGFFGLPVVRAILPDHPEVACYSACFMVSMNILVFTTGVFFLTGEKKHISLKSALLNPTVIGFVLGLPFFLFDLGRFLPDVLKNAVSILGNMTTPLCMIILGIRLASAPLKSILADPTVYAASFLKLLIFPVFSYGIVSLFPLPFAFRAAVLILSGTPCASVMLSMAEIYGNETERSAGCVLISTLFSFLSVPVLTLLLPG